MPLLFGLFTASPHLGALSAQQRATCGDNPGRVCLDVLRITGSQTAAKAADALTIPIEIVIIVIVAVLIRAVLARVITRIVKRTAAGVPLVGRVVRGRAAERLGEFTASPIAAARREQRAETIGSVLRSVTSFFVYGIAFIEILGVIGVNLAPIIASAGIVGVAVGFGAQNLVRDFITGIFMILEDQYGVGDVIDPMDGISGSVESVGLRTTRLRDVNGVVWHIRNGTINRVGNKSQGWSRALLDIPIDVSQSIPHVRAVIKEVADSVWHDAAFADVVLEEPEVWGVESYDTNGLIVRLVVKTRPLKQWDIARELRQRLKEAFDREGIEMPVSQHSIWVHTTGDDRPGPGMGHTDVAEPAATDIKPNGSSGSAAEQVSDEHERDRAVAGPPAAPQGEGPPPE